MKLILSLILSAITLLIHAQNLVPNPSFEEYIECPESLALITFPSWPPSTVTGWTKPTNATSDYYNSCLGDYGDGWLVSIPQNFVGYQTARTGNAYAGFIGTEYPFIEASDYREYIQARLLTPLIAGKEYYVSFYLSLAERANLVSPLAIDQIGIYFDTIVEEDFISSDALTDRVPQIASAPGIMLNDTINWMHVSGSFIATGGEEWITIGSFTPKEEINIQIFKENPWHISYYYIDDVSVIDIAASSTFAIIDTFMCVGSEQAIKGKDSASAYLWDDGSTEQSRYINEAGTYWVRSINEAAGTIHTDTFKVSETRRPMTINLGSDTTICQRRPLTLAVINPEFDSFRWNRGDTTASIEVTGPGTYYVAAWSDCYYGADTILIKEVPAPEVKLPEDMLLCNGDPVELAYFQTGNSYYWSTGSEECCITVNKPGIYSLTLTNICGDKDTDEIKIIYSGCDNCILAPNAFSPNEDGLNDQFKVYINCILKQYKLSIFNRWGQMVFTTSEIDKGWDGTFNGVPCDDGVYFYRIEAIPQLKEIGEISTKGDIILIR